MSRYSDRVASLSPAKQALLARELAAKLDELEAARSEPIAIIGFACRFPGAVSDPESFWRLLRDGVDAVRDVPEDRWPVDAFYDPTPGVAGKISTRSGGFVDAFEAFDAHFFQISPHEADRMDPQHRWLLEVAWQALEDAAQNPDGLIGSRTGVFVGIIGGEHALAQAARGLDASAIDGALGLGVTAGIAAGRLSYFLGLEGPSLTVDTQCSSSLVATHLACESLRNRECDLALAGGSQAMLAPFSSIFLSQARALSADGRCKAFDAAADGYGRGEGCGIVVLKRLSDARACHDNVLALVRGSAVNHGGRSGGLVVPNGAAQETVIRDALRRANVHPFEIDYLEAHGTGTQLGDPIEARAAGAVLGEERPSDRPLWIGSVKTNIGHTEAAAGVAGLIKVVLAMQKGVIPPHLHFRTPNAHIDLAEIPARIPTEATPWPSKAGHRWAGVSSFGLGGTNAHVVVSDFESQDPARPATGPQLLVLSAKTRRSLEEQTARLASHLRSEPSMSLADAAYTLQVGRKSFPWRRALICSRASEAAAWLSEGTPGRLLEGLARSDRRPVAFMLSGVGEHYENMALGLYRSERVFRDAVDECSAVLEPQLGFDLRHRLFPALSLTPSAADARRTRSGGVDLRRMVGRDEASEVEEEMSRTIVSQPAVFVVDYAMARLWMSWGIRAEAMIGHSVGELVAACLAEVFDVDDALRLVAVRARLVEDAPGGAMLAVNLAEEELLPLLSGGLCLSATNAPAMCVVGGSLGEVAELETRLAERHVARRRLKTRHAFHSRLLKAAGDRFSEYVGSVRRRPPVLPFVSNVTGAWITGEQATEPSYWGEHLSATVRFAEGLDVLAEDPERVLLEVGPGQSLTSFALQRVGSGEPSGSVAIPSIRSAYDRSTDEEFALGALARLWLSGVAPAWEDFHSRAERRRVRLPSYAFDRQCYRLESNGSEARLASASSGSKQALEDWFYAPTWKQSVPQVHDRGSATEAGSLALVFLDERGIGRAVVERLAQSGRKVVTVVEGPEFRELEGAHYAVDPGREGDYRRLLRALRREGRSPSEIYHLLSVDGEQRARTADAFDRSQDRGFYSLLFLLQALGSEGTDAERRVVVVTAGTQDVLGTESLRPENATLVGPVRVAPSEYGGIRCRLVDIDLPNAGFGTSAQLADAVVREAEPGSGEAVVAYRRGRRWVQQFDRVRMSDELAVQAGLRAKGVYWIVGGLGSIGLALGRELAERAEARLVLTGRTGLPPRDEWKAWVDGHEATDPVSERIRAVCDMEAAGASVLVMSADVSDVEQMGEVVAEAKRRFGQIDGVFHAAGVPGAGLMSLKTRELADAVLAPKAKGALVLEALLEREPVDFIVYFSSLFSILGGVGQVDYCGANAFLDALACDRNRRGTPNTLSVLWGAWRADPWQDRLLSGTPELQRRMREFRARVGIEFAEGTEALLRCLAAKLPCTLVSPPDLSSLRAQIADLRLSGITGLLAPDRRLHGRPALTTEFVEPGDDVERRLAEIWRSVLGLTAVGIHDGFLELGGNSLLATQIVARTMEAFEVECSASQLFATPTISEFAGAIAAMESTAEAGGLERPAPVPRNDDLVLSPPQERLWYLDRLDPGNPAYNYVLAARLRGPLDVDALEEAVADLVSRHEILRTFFPERAGRPVQVIATAERLPIERLDLREVADALWDAEWRRIAREFSRRPFDLARGPLLRVMLLERAPEDHVLLAAAHHIVIDHLSVPIFLAEIAQLYGARRGASAVSLPELPIQYADFAHWQRRRLSGSRLAELCEFWMRQFSGPPPVLELPADRPRPSVLGARGCIELRALPKELLDRLEMRGREEGATLYMIMMAAFAVLLARYTGQDEFVLGAPIDLRSRREFEPLIGFFIETLAFRMNLTGNPTFRELVRRVREFATGAYAHRELPFDRLVRALGVKRDMSRTPLYQATFLLVDALEVPTEVAGLSLERLEVDRGAAITDVSLLVERKVAGGLAKIEYNTDLFDEERVRRMLRHYETLLEGVARDPEAGIWELPVIDEAEQRRVLVEWNETRRSIPEDLRIHEAFEAQVLRSPDAVALVVGAERLSYRVLNERANRIAGALRRRGIGAEALVGISLERGSDLIPAMLGVLKSGGAYVPLDPVYPNERLGVMLEDAAPTCVVTKEAWRERFEGLGAKVLALDAAEPPIASESERNVPTEGSGKSLAYVLYTSGSSGVPKGVAVEHRNVVNLLEWGRSEFTAAELRGVLGATSISFDPSVFEIFLPLSCGGSVILAENVIGLPQLTARDQVTLMVTVPSLMSELLRVAELPSSVRTVILGAELLSPQLVERVFRQGAVERLLDFYGPTETTVVSTCAVRKPGEPATIGRPIANTSVYLMDENGRPVPVGVAGEVYIGGFGLARGYVNRPELTAAAFVRRELGGGSEERLYRTGDMARYRADGTLEYLGRSDQQVKLRGFRIELGEIEATLRRHPHVREAAACLQTDGSGRRRILGYVVPQGEVRPPIHEIREFVRARLPQYMVPAAIATLESIPLTRTGKVDREALPEISTAESARASAYQAPRNEVEGALAEIWSRVLGQERVGILDDFFELGGDSILAIHMVARAREAGIALRPRMLLEGPTILELARRAGEASVGPGAEAEISGPVSLSPIQRWFLDAEPCNVDRLCLRFVLKLRRSLDPEIFDRALRALAARHEALRLRLRQTEHGWEQWIAPAEEAARQEFHGTLDLSKATSAERADAIAAEARWLQQNLNVREGPIWRVRIVRCGADSPDRLLIVVHHFAFDFVAARVCLAELERLYEQYLHGEEGSLPAKTSSVQAWNRRLEEYARSEVLEDELPFWIRQFESGFRVPLDFAPPPEQLTEGSVQRWVMTLDRGATERLLTGIREDLHCSVRDALLTALLRTLQRWTGSSSLQVGLIGHGREDLFEDLDVSRTIGWFSTRFPLHFELDAAGGRRAALERVRKQLTELPRQGVGYLALRYMSEIPTARRKLKTLGEPDVVFDYLGQFDQLEQASLLFSPDADLIGRVASADTPLREKIGLAAAVTDRGLRLEWTYSSLLHSEETIARLADWFSAEVHSLVGKGEGVR